VVLAGDLTDFGRADQYAHLADLLASLPMPVYLMPGNHDDRDQLRRSFATHTYLGSSDYVQYLISVGEVSDCAGLRGAGEERWTAMPEEDLDQDAPSAWVMEPPGFHLHAWSGAGRLVTHAAASGQFDGPHPFHDGGALID
jgi:hypothetical protein